MDSSKKNELKVLIIGPTGVGKSTFIYNCIDSKEDAIRLNSKEYDEEEYSEIEGNTLITRKIVLKNDPEHKNDLKSIQLDENKVFSYEEINKIKDKYKIEEELKKEIYNYKKQALNNVLRTFTNEEIGADVEESELVEFVNSKVLKNIKEKNVDFIQVIQDLDKEALNENNVAYFIKYIELELKMNKKISTAIGIDEIILYDSRGIYHADKNLMRNKYNNVDATIVMLHSTGVKGELIDSIISQYGISVDTPVEPVIRMSKWSISKEEDKDNDKVMSYKNKILSGIRRKFKELKLIPKEKVDTKLYESVLGKNLGSILPEISLSEKDIELEFYEEQVIQVLKKLYDCKRSSQEVLTKVRTKIENNDSSIVKNIKNSIPEIAQQISSATIDNECINLVQYPRKYFIKKHVIEEIVNKRNKTNKDKTWSWGESEYLEHYTTEAGIKVIQEYIKKCNLDEKKMSEDKAEEIVLLRSLIRFSEDLDEYESYLFRSEGINIKRISEESYGEGVLKTRQFCNQDRFAANGLWCYAQGPCEKDWLKSIYAMLIQESVYSEIDKFTKGLADRVIEIDRIQDDVIDSNYIIG